MIIEVTMKNKKGFAFIEIIVVILIITSSLLVLYSSYKSILDKEKERLYRDDVSYIYRAYFSMGLLFKNNGFTIDPSWFSEKQLVKEIYLSDYNLEFLNDAYHINKTFILKPNSELIMSCKNDYNNTNCATNACIICFNLFKLMDKELYTYTKSINYANHNYIVIMSFSETLDGSQCNETSRCVHHYTWLDTGVSYE